MNGNTQTLPTRIREELIKKEGDENPSVRIFLLTRESRVDSSPWVDLSPRVVIFLEQTSRDSAYTRR